MLRHFAGRGHVHGAVMFMALTACAADAPPFEPDAGQLPVQLAVADADANAAVYWNELARQMVISTNSPTPFAIRGYAVVSVAQYQAAIAAERAREGGERPSVHAAISAASVTALSYLFPSHAASLETMLDEYLVQPEGGNPHNDVAAGEQIGRAIGQQMVMRAQGDNFFAPWMGTVPTGPGMWYSSSPTTPPGGAGFGAAKTYMLMSGDQFRPVPPPAFGSAEFAAALQEVRQFSDTRTPQQDSIAKFWHLPPGTYAPPGYWNEEAAQLVVKYRRDETESARTLALVNIALFDALVASHEAKYTYWLLRPSQADAGITLSVGLPNFPSYPSNHAAISMASARVLGLLFPQERTRLHGRAREAALSRVFGGIHYRFDGEAGLELGRRVGDWTMENAPKKKAPLVLR